MSPSPSERDELRALLCSLQDAIQCELIAERDRGSIGELSRVANVTPADTHYRIDEVCLDALLAWFSAHWPARWPVELVVEGLEERGPVVFPERVTPDQCRLRCIIDPIDGTRGFMFDKRSAWILAGIAPQRGADTRLSDIFAAAMTELPVSKQRLADQLSAVRGCGAAGIVAERVDLSSGVRTRISPAPSSATDFRHGFVSFARFFPQARVLLASFEERFWQALYGDAADGGDGEAAFTSIFDDQYISSAGQFHQLLAGHDRMGGDLRPFALATLGQRLEAVCHPYDVCTLLILEEAGCPLGTPSGQPLDAPLDTTTPVAWIGFANAALAERARPALQVALRETFGAGGTAPPVED